MPEPAPVLIAAISGRALAASARRCGYAPLVADLFADQDTRAAAHAHVQLPSESGLRIEEDALLTALETLAAGRAPCGVVCGTGFEDKPALLVTIDRRFGLIGNGADVVARVKDPLAFAKLCGEASVPHPDVTLVRPPDAEGWLAKRPGGAGGRHIRLDVNEARPGDYFQRRTQGTPVSALLLADGVRALILGFSVQWPAPAPGAPFRYGGAARPARLPDDLAHAMGEAAARLVAAAGLVGLNSADFLATDDGFQLLEINPRPGASFDLFEPPRGSLFALHVAACRGMLPTRAPRLPAAGAGAIVYASRSIARMPDLQWPDWTSDRPATGSAVASGAPLCTVLASADDADDARRLVEQRAAAILATLDARLS